MSHYLFLPTMNQSALKVELLAQCWVWTVADKWEQTDVPPPRLQTVMYQQGGHRAPSPSPPSRPPVNTHLSPRPGGRVRA